MTRAQVLLAIAAVLALGLAWQNWPAPEAPSVGTKPAPTPATRPAPVSAPLGQLAAHPLFSPSRRPPPTPAAELPGVPATPAEPAPPAETPPPPAPVLQGLILTPEPGAAYLAEGPGGRSHFLRVGDEALGLALLEVLPGKARFRGAEGEVTLPLWMPEEGDDPLPQADAPPDGSVLPPEAFAPVAEAP